MLTAQSYIPQRHWWRDLPWWRLTHSSPVDSYTVRLIDEPSLIVIQLAFWLCSPTGFSSNLQSRLPEVCLVRETRFDALIDDHYPRASCSLHFSLIKRTRYKFRWSIDGEHSSLEPTLHSARYTFSRLEIFIITWSVYCAHDLAYWLYFWVDPVVKGAQKVVINTVFRPFEKLKLIPGSLSTTWHGWILRYDGHQTIHDTS